MGLPPSTRPSGSRERRSSAFIREDSGLPNAHEGEIHAPKESLDVEHDYELCEECFHFPTRARCEIASAGVLARTWARCLAGMDDTGLKLASRAAALL